MFFEGMGGAIFSGLAGLFGGLNQNSANKDMMDQQNQFNASEAQKNRAWQEGMSNTAYRRAMDDMRAAGLNPMLAYQQGGASSPGGATASGQAARMEDAIGRGVNSAVETRRLKKEIDQVDSSTKLNEAMGEAQMAQAKAATTTAKKVEKEVEAITSQLPAIKSRAKADQKAADWDNYMGDYDAVNNRVRSGLGSVNSALDALNPLKKLMPGGVPKGAEKVWEKKFDELMRKGVDIK